MSGKHIELFLVDGEPGGITTADVAGWTGHILIGPRSDLNRLLAREDANRNGVYLLLGEDPSSIESTTCYIGRTESFTARFRDHDRNRDWWDRAVLISSRDDSFNEGHWGYLEARLLNIAARAERCSLPDNKQKPQLRRLSEAQISDAEAFLAQVRGILPVLGVNVLRATASTTPGPLEQAASGASPVFRLTVARNGIDARARVVGDEFLLLEGSRVTATWTGVGSTPGTRRSYAAYRERHAKLVADGSIRVNGTTAVVTRDIPFTSPSAAGTIATGHSCNGRTSWLWNAGTYGDWENRDLPTATAPGNAAQREDR